MTETKREVHLNRYHHFTRLMRESSVKCALAHYKSRYDGTTQSVLIMQPIKKRPRKLFFFFHGMDGDCGDGVVLQDLARKLDATLVCMGGRGPSWVSDAFLQDAEQVIDKYVKGYRDFYMIGISMGATQALSLAGLLPKRLSNLLAGVIALMPAANLEAVLERTSHKRVRDTLSGSVNRDTSKLKERSPGKLIDSYKADLPFSIFYREADTILLSHMLKDFISVLRKRYPVSIFTAPGDHEFKYENFDYEEVFKALGKNLEKRIDFR